jgi:effector-binding domain-containing protein
MISEPTIEQRDEQPYVGIRTQVSMQDFAAAIQPSFVELGDWMERNGIEHAGPRMIRYHAIDSAGNLDVEMAVPVAASVQGEGRINRGAMPAGRYAKVLYTGPYDGLYEANSALVGWAETNGIAWDNWEGERGDTFAGRAEWYYDDPAGGSDPSRWETEVGIKLKD